MANSDISDRSIDGYVVKIPTVIMPSDKMQAHVYSTQPWIPKRYIIALLIFFGNVCMQMVHGNLGMAIVEMTTRNTSIQLTNGTVIYGPAEFDWNMQLKGIILSLFTYGYIMSMLGGVIATKYGGATVYGSGITITAILSLFSPFILRTNFYAFLFFRVLEGVCLGFSYSSVYEVWVRWVPVEERSKLLAVGLCGQTVGFAITFPLCGYFAHRWGWPSIFYATGGIVLCWSLIWFTFVSNDPSTDKWISKCEQLLLKEKIKSPSLSKNILSVPWSSIITCKSILALALGKFIFGFAYVGFMQCLPLYVHDVTKTEIQNIGLLSALPNIIPIFAVPMAGHILDCIQNKKKFTISQIHRTFLVAGFTLASVGLIGVGIAENFIFAMTVFILFKIIMAFTHVIIYAMTMYIAPNCASAVVGLTGMCFQLGNSLTPIFVGFTVHNHTQAEWSIYFSLCGVLFLLVAGNFFVFANSEEQIWTDKSQKIKTHDGYINVPKNEQGYKT